MWRLWKDNALGITPAYAGNTVKIFVKNVTQKDHPRIRGEHAITGIKEYANTGSPPHTRGTLGALSGFGTNEGITPAYAGNTKDGL